jgi:hypothetical protein
LSGLKQGILRKTFIPCFITVGRRGETKTEQKPFPGFAKSQIVRTSYKNIFSFLELKQKRETRKKADNYNDRED